MRNRSLPSSSSSFSKMLSQLSFKTSLQDPSKGFMRKFITNKVPVTLLFGCYKILEKCPLRKQGFILACGQGDLTIYCLPGREGRAGGAGLVAFASEVRKQREMDACLFSMCTHLFVPTGSPTQGTVPHMVFSRPFHLH